LKLLEQRNFATEVVKYKLFHSFARYDPSTSGLKLGLTEKIGC